MTFHLEYWYQALRSKYGLRLSSTTVEATRVKLYAARRESGDPALDALVIIRPAATPGELWIIHKEISTDAPPEE